MANGFRERRMMKNIS